MFKFMLILFILMILIFPFWLIVNYLSNNDKLLNHYVILDASLKQDMSLLSDSNIKHFTSLESDLALYDLDENSYYELLKSKYWEIDIEDINSKIKTNYIFLIMYSIFDFIFIYWLFVMAFTSFYRRELK
jgi:hypothetical protein